MACVALPAGADGVNDGQVAVEANAGQKEDSTVAVQGEEGTGNFAGHETENPLVSPLYGKQRQSESQQEVRDGQVEKEGVGQRESTGAAAGVPVTANHGQHQHVAHSCQDEHQGVDDGGVALRKLIDAVLCTWGCLAPACFRISVLILLIILDRKDIIIKKNTFLFSTKKTGLMAKMYLFAFGKVMTLSSQLINMTN